MIGTANFASSSAAYLGRQGRKQLYITPDGPMERVTTVLNSLPKPFLIDWAAKKEREAVLEALEYVARESDWLTEAIARDASGASPDELAFLGDHEFANPARAVSAFRLRALVDYQLGTEREHQRIVREAADDGTLTHQEIQRQTQEMLGIKMPPAQPLRDRVQWGVMAWQDWLKKSKLRPVLCEQVVWDRQLGAGGTVDCLALNEDDELGVLDYKTSKRLYDTHHIQVAAYARMANNFAPIKWATLVNIPMETDKTEIVVRPCGELEDRTLTQLDMLKIFEAANTIHRLLTSRPTGRNGDGK